MKYLVIFLVLVGFVGTSFAEDSDYALTPFDIMLSEDDFTTKGPNHSILMLERNQSATINITIQNNDDKLHKITLTNPKYSSNLFDYFVFEPDQIMVPANQQNSTKLYLKIANDTNIHSSFTTILAQSNVFGMKGIGFVIVVDREIDDLTDKSLRAGLPGPAFSRINGDISEYDAEKMIDNGFGTPKFLPMYYHFQGMTDWGQSKQFIYSPVPVDNSTESIVFWEGGGMMINYYNNADRPNINNTKSLPVRIAQDEGQQIMINGQMGMAIEKQTRMVAYSNTTYDVPSEVEFFDDVKRSVVSLHANMQLDELLKIASSIPVLDEMDSMYDESDKSKQYSERLDPDPVLELWNNHAEIIDGTIVSKTVYPSMGKGMTEFHVKINKFFKPLSKNTESITLFASYEDSDIPDILNEGDRALIYIESGNQISEYSVKVDKSTYCEPRDYVQIGPVLPNDPNQLVRGSPTLPFDWKDQCVADYFIKDPNFWMQREYRPPMQQWKVHSIPIDEQRCSGEGEDFVSVQKIGNSIYKYCVKLESVPKLVQREWGISSNWIKISNANKAIHYELKNSSITSIDAFSEYKNQSLPGENKQTWLEIKLKSTQDGFLQIILPRNLIDSKINSLDDDFFVLLDGTEIEYQETKTDSERMLNFSIPAKTNIVEILGYGYYNPELNQISLNSSESKILNDAEMTLSITPQKTHYLNNETIHVVGHIDNKSLGYPVGITAVDWKNNIVKQDHVELDHKGNFNLSHTISEFCESGKYYIILDDYQSGKTKTVYFDVQYTQTKSIYPECKDGELLNCGVCKRVIP